MSPCCPRDLQESSPAQQFQGFNSLSLCFLYGPAPTTILDHWEDHILDHTNLCWQSNVSALQHTVWACQHFPAKKQLPSAIMAAVALHSDLPTKRKSVTASTFSPSVRQAVMGLDAINLVFGFLKKKFINYQFHHFLHDNFLPLFPLLMPVLMSLSFCDEQSST